MKKKKTKKKQVKPTRNCAGKNKFKFLIDRAWIIGIVDAYDSVHSRLFDFENADMHGDIWPMQTFNRWRWDFDKAITTVTGEDALSKEHFDFVTRHLTRKYGIKFWDNGYHDIDYLIKKAADGS